MKKLILLILVCSLLLLMFVGCNDSKAPDNTTDDTTTDDILSETTPLASNSSNQPKNPDEELIKTLITYLEQYLTQYNLKGKSLFKKIDDIKEGIQPLHVVFNPNDYYYMCGYYTPTHEYEEYIYCCAKGYTWAKYENETDILQFYDSQPCMVVFQINKSLSVTDILSSTVDAPSMQHFQIYQPTFENGINTAPPMVYDQSFLYLTYPNCELNGFFDNTIYYSTDFYYHPMSTISCVRLGDRDYLSFFLYSTKKDGTIRETADYTYDFGEYYDVLMSKMEKEKYNFTNEKEITLFYGVISIEDFVNEVLQK